MTIKEYDLLIIRFILMTVHSYGHLTIGKN